MCNVRHSVRSSARAPDRSGDSVSAATGSMSLGNTKRSFTSGGREEAKAGGQLGWAARIRSKPAEDKAPFAEGRDIDVIGPSAQTGLLQTYSTMHQ